MTMDKKTSSDTQKRTAQAVMLGTATSLGVPIIGCSCEVCTSSDPRNHRTRSSCLLKTERANILIDTSTDLYHQALREKIQRVDAIIFTHAHADHIHGIDDIRVFAIYKGRPIDAYASRQTLEVLKIRFPYIFKTSFKGGQPPLLIAREFESEQEICGVPIMPISVHHGFIETLGLRIGNFAYLTDCKSISDDAAKLLEGIEILVIDALRKDSYHHSHMILPESLDTINRLKPRRNYLTHLTHQFNHTVDNEYLPPGVELAYDGLTLDITY